MEKNSITPAYSIAFGIINETLDQNRLMIPRDSSLPSVHNSGSQTEGMPIRTTLHQALSSTGSCVSNDQINHTFDLDTTNSETLSETGSDDKKLEQTVEHTQDTSEESTTHPLLTNSTCVSLTSLYGDYECLICFELMLEPTTLPCHHTYCRGCVAMYYNECDKHLCPICRRHWSTVPPVNTSKKLEILERFPVPYNKRLLGQTDKELQTIKQMESLKKVSKTVAKMNHMDLSQLHREQWRIERSYRICLTVMGLFMVLLVLGLLFLLP